MKLNVKREELTFPNEDIDGNPDETWTYLSIYDKKGNLLVRSDRNHFQNEIRLEFEGIVWVSTPSGEIFMTYDSLLRKFEQEREE